MTAWLEMAHHRDAAKAFDETVDWCRTLAGNSELLELLHGFSAGPRPDEEETPFTSARREVARRVLQCILSNG